MMSHAKNVSKAKKENKQKTKEALLDDAASGRLTGNFKVMSACQMRRAHQLDSEKLPKRLEEGEIVTIIDAVVVETDEGPRVRLHCEEPGGWISHTTAEGKPMVVKAALEPKGMDAVTRSLQRFESQPEFELASQHFVWGRHTSTPPYPHIHDEASREQKETRLSYWWASWLRFTHVQETKLMASYGRY